MYKIEVKHEGVWVGIDGQFLTLYDAVGHAEEPSNCAPVHFASEYQVLDEKGDVVPAEVLDKYRF